MCHVPYGAWPILPDLLTFCQIPYIFPLLACICLKNMKPENKEYYLEIVKQYLVNVQKGFSVNNSTDHEMRRSEQADSIPPDTHSIICSHRPSAIKQTIEFLERCKPSSTVKSGAEIELQSTLDGDTDIMGSFIYFEPTKEIPTLVPIPKIPPFISLNSRMGKRFLGQTAGTVISVPSEVDGVQHIWEAKICKVE